MCTEGWALRTICNFCVMWSWANTCDEHSERKILKTIVKRSELCYFPLKNIHMWLWIGWLSDLHRHVHVAVLLLFRRKWNRWNVFAESQCLQLQMLHLLEDIAPVGPHSHHSKVEWRTRLGVICLLYQLGAEPKLTWLHCFWARGPCIRLSQNVEGVDAQQPMPREVCVRHCLSTGKQALHRTWTSVHCSFWSLLFPSFFSPKASTPATNQTLEKTFSAVSLSWSSVFLFPLCLLSSSLL